MRNRTLVSKWLLKERKVMSSVSTAFMVHYNQKLGGTNPAILGETHHSLWGIDAPGCRYNKSSINTLHSQQQNDENTAMRKSHSFAVDLISTGCSLHRVLHLSYFPVVFDSFFSALWESHAFLCLVQITFCSAQRPAAHRIWSYSVNCVKWLCFTSGVARIRCEERQR